LIFREVVRHEQQLGVVPFELGNHLGRELLRANGIDPLDDIGAGCGRDPPEQIELLLVAEVTGGTAGGACLSSQ
jgi:hypothetical protein